jgi:Transposase/Transposase IS116/IS110/IS902 family
MIFAGVDWAEAHHDVHVQDEDGKRLGGGRLPEGVEGIARFHELVARYADEPGQVVIGIETDRGLFVAALVAAGYQVFAVNPMSVSRYRDRHSASGAKPDPGDAKVLADLVRTDRHNHRPVAGDSDLAGAVKVLARADQSMIWSRRRQANMLRSALREFYPAALAAFDDLTSGDAAEVLRAAPAPALGAALSRAKIAAALRRGGQRHIDARATQIQAALRTPQLAPAPLTASAMGASVSASAAVIAEMTAQIAVLERQLAADFEQHPDAEVVRSLPGLGTIPGARVLGEFGDAPARYATAKCRKNYGGTSPITRASGTRRVVLARYVRNQRLAERALPLGLLRPQRLARRPGLLRHPPRRRRHPPRRPPRPRQPPGRHPARLPGPPHPLQRNHRPGPPHQHQPHPRRLTLPAVGCLAGTSAGLLT